MNPRAIVLEQIRHHETVSVPYTLAFEQDAYDRLDRPSVRPPPFYFPLWAGNTTVNAEPLPGALRTRIRPP